jgi:uroporphyrinogen decarboxylase
MRCAFYVPAGLPSNRFKGYTGTMETRKDKSVKKRVVRAAKGLSVDRTPIWIMRQAGRYLPEYHQTKDKAGGFMGLCKIPEYGIEVALQPIRRFGFDAAILFSDILIPVEAMGIEVDFNPGPVIENPVRTEADAARLIVPEPEEKMPFALEILKGLEGELPSDVTLIGFAGAPFTAASYMVSENSGKGHFEAIRKMAYSAPHILDTLLDKLVSTTVKYLRAQIQAGAEVVQLFDSSAWQLPGHMFSTLALDPAGRVIKALSDTGVPVIYFAPGAMSNLDAMSVSGADVIGVDWRIGLQESRRILGDSIAVQGNLDPAALLGSKAFVQQESLRVIVENRGRPGHIFNLGHGILPDTPIENVEALVETVRAGAPS